MTDRLTLTAAQAAAYAGMSLKTFRNARRAGQGPDAFTAHGGRTRFAKAALDRWVNDRHDRDPLAPRKAS